MARRYSQEVKNFIEENVAGRTARELAELTNAQFGTAFTEGSMKSYKMNHKLKSGTPSGIPKGRASTTYPQPIFDFIHENYAGCGPKEMTEKINAAFGTEYTVAQIKGYYANHKLNSGTTGYFDKGHIPANKGQKGRCAPGCEKTQFRKGNLPASTKPIGYERITQDGYIEVKIKMRPSRPDCNDNFVAKHRLVWEKANGPIPPGNVLIFRDGDKTNCELSNLRMITLAENCELNRRELRSSNPDFTDTGILIAKVNTTAFAKKKKTRKI